jgi:hypothetical protein
MSEFNLLESDNEVFLAGTARRFEGLRKTGMTEE